MRLTALRHSQRRERAPQPAAELEGLIGRVIPIRPLFLFTRIDSPASARLLPSACIVHTRVYIQIIEQCPPSLSFLPYLAASISGPDPPRTRTRAGARTNFNARNNDIMPEQRRGDGYRKQRKRSLHPGRRPADCGTICTCRSAGPRMGSRRESTVFAALSEMLVIGPCSRNPSSVSGGEQCARRSRLEADGPDTSRARKRERERQIFLRKGISRVICPSIVHLCS